MKELISLFQSTFNDSPSYFLRSPGRINLIGEHTDYNLGFVMPMAIDKSIYMAVKKNQSRKLRVYSKEINEKFEINLDNFEKGEGHSEYFKGCLNVWKEKGHPLVGMDVALVSDLPVGAGLSSSAALETLFLRAIEMASYDKLEFAPKDIALWAQKAERDWVGVKCGIMDQLACACSKKDFAQLVDCRSLETIDVSVPSHISFLVLDTGTRRDLHSSEFNLRQQQCFEAAKKLSVSSLREVSSGFDKSLLNEQELKRVRHVISENERVHQVKEALSRGDDKRFGELLNQGHESLANNFEVSTKALDDICQIARSQEGTLGSRMVGAGFGGCAIAAVESAKAESTAAIVESEYSNLNHGPGKVYICNSAAGTSLMENV